MLTPSFKEKIKRSIKKGLEEFKKTAEPKVDDKDYENKTKEELLELKKKLKKDFKVNMQYRKLEQAELNVMIEKGLFGFDAMFDACTETGEGFAPNEVRYKDRWVDAGELQRAYRNPKYAKSHQALDSLQGDAVNTINNNSKGAVDEFSNIMLPKMMGYGALSPYQSNIWVRKIINLKAKSIYGKGFVLNGDGTDKTNEDIKTLYKAFDKFKVRKVLITALKRSYLFGGVSIVPKIKGVSREGLKKELKFDSNHIPKGSLQGFNVVSPYFCTPMIPNTTDGTGDFYYDPEHWFLIDKLIHASRIINLATDSTDEYQSSLYYYRGISMVQSLIKYIFQVILSGNSTANSMLQNSLWIMETSKNYMTDKNFQKMVAKIAKERSNSMIVPLSTPDKFSILQIDISNNADITRFFQETIATLIDAPHTLFLGIAAKGLTTSGIQEMKNWHDIIQTDRVDIGYDDALVTILNETSLSELGRINPSITIQNVELDETYEMNRVQAGLGLKEIYTNLFELGCWSSEQITNFIAQCSYHPMNKVMQMQVEGRNNAPDETEQHDISDYKLNDMDAEDSIEDDYNWDNLEQEINDFLIKECIGGRDVITGSNETWKERMSHRP